MSETMNVPKPGPDEAQRARQRRTLRLALAHALLAVAILAGFVFMQSHS